MSAKRTSWNEFSLAMASAVICLSTGDLSTHSTKYISPTLTQKVFANIKRVGKGCSGVETPLFEGMLVAREPEEQVDVEEQGNADTTAEEPETAIPEDAANDQPIPSPTSLNPPPQQPQDVPLTSHAQSPLLQPHSLTPAQTQGAHFPMNLLQEALDACAALSRRVEHLEQDKVAQDLEIIKLNTMVKKLTNKAKTLKLRRLRKVETSQRVDTSDDTLMEDVSNQGRVIDRDEDDVKEADEVREYTADTQVKGRQADIYNIDMDHAAKVLSMPEEESEVQKAVEVVTTAKLITKFVAAISEIVSAIAVIPFDVPETISVAAVPTEESSAKTPTKTSSKDNGKGILVEEPKPIKKKQQVELDEAYARKLQEEINQDIDWEVAMDHNTSGFRLDYFKGINYDDIRPIFVAKYNENMEFLLKSKEQMEEEESRAITLINQTPAQKAAKRRKLIEEAKEAESIKQHLQIVPDEDDDVFTEATPLARKVPVMDYQVISVNNKPRYKIIKADDTHQLFASFISMLKNVDREDLETLWSIVKERFSTSKPNNFSDEYLLTALKTMFKRPDGQDNIPHKLKVKQSILLVVLDLNPRFKLLDENQVLLRVPRENNMYNVNLKDIVPSGDLTCLFAKAIIDQSNLWHRRLGHVNFKTINKLVKGNLVRGLPTKVFENKNTCVACKKGKQHRASWEEADQQYMLFPVWSTGSTNPQNKEGDATFDGKEHDAKKPESIVNLSPSSSALSGEQNDMTKKKDKGEILIARQNYSNSTNPISAAGPSNTNTSPIHGKSLLQDASQSPGMLESEDIVYSDHENVVKRIFRYLMGKPNLGLWYPKDSPFDLVAYSDSDYAGTSMDRKSTTGGCQFIGSRLISWQCKKQTVIATSSTEAEYVAGASCCAQVL
nr:uncharacterized mitochondrial protein AtMg00810-like [Tanacetum cinerariifolium]